MPENTERSSLSTLPRKLLGRRSDWHLRVPSIRLPRPGIHWFGPLALIASVVFTWPAFSGAVGEDGNVAFGLFIGAASIMLMAWSFLLALRLPILERMFGGLDSMYRVHRWAGSLAVVAMFLHTRAEPEIEGGIRGASRSLADQAEDLAGTGEMLLYILVGLSLIRWFPYRYWRWTHKLLGIPFAFACFHFYTAEKPYANGSGWGWYFGIAMLVGLITYVWRVVIRDMLLPGRRYRVSAVRRSGSTSEIELAAVGRPMPHKAGQFAVLKFQRRGLREPHVFTIASTPASPVLRFFIRDLGDWTSKINELDLEGTDVIVEGPYGTFEPLHDGAARNVWIAGGVGITPFLSALDGLTPTDQRPTLFYCVRDRADASAIEVLETAAAEGRLDLEMMVSGEGSRFSDRTLVNHFGPDGLSGAHVAACGPAGLVATAASGARAAGASDVETEDFDIRSGFGPDMSREVDRLVSGARQR